MTRVTPPISPLWLNKDQVIGFFIAHIVTVYPMMEKRKTFFTCGTWFSTPQSRREAAFQKWIDACSIFHYNH
jgi:hypothetical protein